MNHRKPAFLVLLLVGAAARCGADEGMWTLDNLPKAQLERRYHFTPTRDWLERARLASVRFNDGGSGAFVSPDGLVLTNHHVALGQLSKVSTEKNDYVKNGFFARTPDEELKCPDLELNVLESMQDVTRRVLSAVKPRAPLRVQNEQRKAAMARVEKECSRKTGLRCDVIELYEGGEYWLYRYKKYTDVRLVMAPEQQAAFYGRDPDNFTYPRFDLDFAFFRVYEKGRPVRPKQYFRWSPRGAADGELVFVTGNPGFTERQKTVSQLEFDRDTRLPLHLQRLKSLRAALEAYSAGGAEEARRAQGLLFMLRNSVKALDGELRGLQDPKLIALKRERQKPLRAKAPEAFDKIAQAQKLLESRQKQREFRSLFGSKLAMFAMTIVLESEETAKPNDRRFEEFRDSNLDSLNFRLLSPAPVYPDLEQAALTDILGQAQNSLGADDPWVRAALQGRAPADEARELVAATKLADPAVRKALVQGGLKAVDASDDPLILWARRLDPAYRELRKWHEDNIQSVEALEGNRIAKARFALYGKSEYPDATFTLRLSFGKVAGYDELTTRVPYKTTFYGLFDRGASFDDAGPYQIPARVDAARSRLDLSVPLDFVATNDIVGGNSGSPVFNRDAELVGLIFDGNIQSLVWDYVYSAQQGRAVAVHSSAILQALRKIYGMDALADELEAKR